MQHTCEKTEPTAQPRRTVEDTPACQLRQEDPLKRLQARCRSKWQDVVGRGSVHAWGGASGVSRAGIDPCLRIERQRRDNGGLITAPVTAEFEKAPSLFPKRQLNGETLKVRYVDACMSHLSCRPMEEGVQQRTEKGLTRTSNTPPKRHKRTGRRGLAYTRLSAHPLARQPRVRS